MTPASSSALSDWRTRLSGRLDELEAVHASVRNAPGWSWAVEQLTGHLFVALVAQFHSFSRTLHDEALDWLRQQSLLAGTLAALASRGRRLDRGNPTPSALSDDFGKLGLKLEPALRQRSPRNTRRLVRLERAVALRNGVVHEDSGQIARAAAGPSVERAVPTLTSYYIHRRALNALAAALDAVVAEYLASLVVTTRP